MTHICISKSAIIGSDNGLSPGCPQVIIWINAGILSIQILGSNFSEIVSKIHTFSFKKMHLKLSLPKWQQFCVSFIVLKVINWINHMIASMPENQLWRIWPNKSNLSDKNDNKTQNIFLANHNKMMCKFYGTYCSLSREEFATKNLCNILKCQTQCLHAYSPKVQAPPSFPCKWTMEFPSFYHKALQWRHNEHDGVSNHQHLDRLLSCLFRHTSKKTSKHCITGFARETHQWLVNSPHKGPVTWNKFPFDDVTMIAQKYKLLQAFHANGPWSSQAFIVKHVWSRFWGIQAFHGISDMLSAGKFLEST